MAKHATCDTTARATDYLKSPVTDTFVAVQTCYKDNAGNAGNPGNAGNTGSDSGNNSSNSALLSIVALFSLICLLLWKFHFFNPLIVFNFQEFHLLIF